MKRLISVLLAVMIVAAVAVVPTSTFVQSSGGFQYIGASDGAVISGYTGNDTELVIPSVIDGYTVTDIGDNAFQFFRSLTSVSRSNRITVMG